MSFLPDSLAGHPLIDFESLDALFVDLDDTIVDYRNSCIVGLSQVKKIVPELASVDLGTLELEFREILRDNLPKLFDGLMTVNQERMMRIGEILRRHGGPTGEEDVRECDRLFTEGFWSMRSLIDGAGRILEICRNLNIPVVVITNGNLDMQLRTLQMLNLERYIHTLLTPTDSSEMKPGRALFERALSVTGADRDRTVMIGDTWQHDVLGALNADITPVWVNSRRISRPEPFEVIEISSLKELLSNSGGR